MPLVRDNDRIGFCLFHTCICAPRVRSRGPGSHRIGVDALEANLNALEGVTVVRRIAPSGVGVFSLGEIAGPGGIMVARATPERGAELIAALQRGAPVIVEHDMLLNHHGLVPLEASAPVAGAVPGAFGRGQLDLAFKVVGTNQAPLARAQIRVVGRNFPGQGETGVDGTASISLFGETPASINAVYVKPFADYWERYIVRPHLTTDDGPNVIELQPLSAMLPRFPQQQMLGWGQELMGLAQVPAHLNGQNVKVAIIDSGCDNTHPQLTHITRGVDLTNPDDPKGWMQDEISHGTHCAGIIAGLASDQQGIRGFAPGAEVLILKVFPGGRFSNLIDALDLCIQRQVDVVNCSPGSGRVSEIVQRKMEEARQKGVACIVAAGNSGGPVQFPATLPGVLAVSAIGQERRFPADSYHAQALMPAMIATNGVFPAKFSCFGPEVKISGPGVATVSTVPGGGYAAWDGTSMAAPHLTGLAALVLAHHPLFQGSLRTRSAQRVDALFQAITVAAQPLVADPQRGGAGLPMAAAALGGTRRRRCRSNSRRRRRCPWPRRWAASPGCRSARCWPGAGQLRRPRAVRRPAGAAAAAGAAERLRPAAGGPIAARRGTRDGARRDALGRDLHAAGAAAAAAARAGLSPARQGGRRRPLPAGALATMAPRRHCSPREKRRSPASSCRKALPCCDEPC